MLLSIAYANENIIYCPKAYNLTKTDLIWSGNAEAIQWKATEASLSEDAVSFIGAQWDGIQVGSISCVYQGSEDLSFPIVLKNEHIFRMPKHTNWQAETDGMYTCHSDDTQDCPLYPNIEKQAKVDIHELMKGIKS